MKWSVIGEIKTLLQAGNGGLFYDKYTYKSGGTDRRGSEKASRADWQADKNVCNPCGCSVIFTVFLSMGAWRLAKKNSLVRKLPSVETLGTVSVLCVDKTGAITMNQMTVQELWVISGEERGMVKIMGLVWRH